MSVDVEVEVIEDGMWCDAHFTHHRVVYLSQPITHQGIPLGPGRIYDECLHGEEAP